MRSRIGLRKVGLRTAIVCAAAWVVTFAGCATMKVDSYVEKGANLTVYRTFDWAPDGSSTSGDARLDNNTFFDERMRADIEKQLAARGFVKASGAEPQLLVHYHAVFSQQVGIPGGDRTENCSDCKPYVYDAGSLLIDLVDARTKALVWRGWAHDRMDGVINKQDWMEDAIDDAVTKILSQLPRAI